MARGIGVLQLDVTGVGSPDRATGSSPDVDDLVGAADRLRAHGHASEILIGHSLGGAAALAAAARIPEVKAVVTLGTPSHPLDRHADLDRPTLVLHGGDDDLVPRSEALRIVDAVGAMAALVPLDGADHLLTRAADADRVVELVDTWSAPYLPGDADVADRPEPGTVVVDGTARTGLAQQIATADHRWNADEPVPVGAGSGPDPYQLLLSSLGACTAMTMRMYADRKGIPLQRATVTLTHDRLHATDCAQCETGTGHVDRIVREIRLEGALDDAQRARLLSIADRCPVHRTLQSEIVIETDEV